MIFVAPSPDEPTRIESVAKPKGPNKIGKAIGRAIGAVQNGVRLLLSGPVMAGAIGLGVLAGCNAGERAAGEALEEGEQLIEAGGDLAEAIWDVPACPIGRYPMTTPECLDAKTSVLSGADPSDQLIRLQADMAQVSCEKAVAETALIDAEAKNSTAESEKAAAEARNATSQQAIDDAEVQIARNQDESARLSARIAKHAPSLRGEKVKDPLLWNRDRTAAQADIEKDSRTRSKEAVNGGISDTDTDRWDAAEGTYDQARLTVKDRVCKQDALQRAIRKEVRRQK